VKLNLTKPLVIFDLETTGLDLVKDRIIQISYIKVYPDGHEERGNELVNPEKPIEPMITQLTGISNDDVKDKPTFKQLGAVLAEKFTGCDFAGFNSNHFDIPLLAEEFLRAGVDFDFSKCKMIDAQTILELDEENRVEMKGEGMYDHRGRKIEYGKKTKTHGHRTPDSVAQDQRITFPDFDRDQPNEPQKEWEGEHHDS
jgi:DNA polymerase-3 subunit epsilon